MHGPATAQRFGVVEGKCFGRPGAADEEDIVRPRQREGGCEVGEIKERLSGFSRRCRANLCRQFERRCRSFFPTRGFARRYLAFLEAGQFAGHCLANLIR